MRRANIPDTNPSKSNDFRSNPEELPTDDKGKPLAQSENKYLSRPEETTNEQAVDNPGKTQRPKTLQSNTSDRKEDKENSTVNQERKGAAERQEVFQPSQGEQSAERVDEKKEMIVGDVWVIGPDPCPPAQ